jgi:hypothetical protein
MLHNQEYNQVGRPFHIENDFQKLHGITEWDVNHPESSFKIRNITGERMESEVS